MSERLLRFRIPVGIALVAIVLGTFYLDAQTDPAGLLLLPLVLLFVTAAGSELIGLFNTGQRPIRSWVVYAGIVLLILSNWAPRLLGGNLFTPWEGWWGPLVALVVSGLLVVSVEVWQFQADDNGLDRMANTLFAVLYVGGLGSFFVQLRWLGAAGPPDASIGLFALLSMIIIVKLSDTGAFFTGRSLGRTKLAPHLSPGKTVEGAVGGIVSALVAAGLCFGLLAPVMTPKHALAAPWWAWSVYGLGIALAGILGDLAVSLIKRAVGAKNSSSWLPGLGGVLDVMDSILFAAPVAYLVWISGCLLR